MRNEIRSSKNYGKYYAHTVRMGEVSMEEIEKTIEENCTAKASDVRLVLRELFDAVKYYMQQGYTVDLREMGKLSIAVTSTSVDKPEDFRVDRHITGFRCKYTPHGKRKGPADDEPGHIRRGLLEGCKAKEHE
ncbi:MAG: hypothetical protein IJ539_00725 [Prevotella sp.]|nr:hypothetical protein [Prevotella sp.]